VSNPDIGFNSDDNAVTLVSTATTLTLPLGPKRLLARQLIDQIAEHFHRKSQRTE
jgi:phosphopantothenoylcysteine decarboxylase/phosphopantothenate--cysteine ligase